VHYVADALLGKIPPGDQSSNGHFLFLIRLSPETSMLAFVTFFQETFFSLFRRKKRKKAKISQSKGLEKRQRRVGLRLWREGGDKEERG